MPRWFKAIAAMAENRVIGAGGRIPWHLPEDFRWFKQKTTGHTVVMGRKTYESIGRPLPNRRVIVLSRSGGDIPSVEVMRDPAELDRTPPEAEVFICGGAEIYAMLLPRCDELFLTLVKRKAEGDVLFPPFEDEFELREVIRETEEFRILRYHRRGLPAKA